MEWSVTCSTKIMLSVTFLILETIFQVSNTTVCIEKIDK